MKMIYGFIVVICPPLISMVGFIINAKNKDSSIKKWNLLGFALCFIFTITISVQYIEEISNREDPIIFQDASFEFIIREILGQHGTPIYPSQLKYITELHIDGDSGSFSSTWHPENTNRYTIANIYDLHNFPNLKKLSIRNNEITDITPILILSNLEHLDLCYNYINDISMISELTKLRYLCLGDNEITDIKAINELTNLEELYLYQNRIVDIAALSNLFNLKQLGLGACYISNIEPISNCDEIFWLNLSVNSISNIEPLTHLYSLRTLYLNNNKIESIDALENKPNLRYLGLSQNRIRNVSALASLREDCIVYIYDNYCDNLNPIVHIKELYHDIQVRVTARRVSNDDVIVTFTSPFRIIDACYYWGNTDIPVASFYSVINHQNNDAILNIPESIRNNNDIILYIQIKDERGNISHGTHSSSGTNDLSWFRFDVAWKD